MKFYRKEDNSVWAFEEDGSQDYLISEDCTPMTEEEILAHITPPVIAPTVVTMIQARLALLSAGHLQTVIDAIAEMPGPEGDYARVEFEYSPTVNRTSPLVQAMSTILDLDDAELDALFLDASTR